MHKYNAKKTVVDGIVFDSKAEARRYKELLLMQSDGQIRGLELQPSFVLQKGFTLCGKRYRAITYIADFKYIDSATGKTIVEDVKGMETDVFKIKKKLFLFLYGKEFEFKITK